jgi:hypothetical protein
MAIPPEGKWVILRSLALALEKELSMRLVLPRLRTRRGLRFSLETARVSASPSRREATAPGWRDSSSFANSSSFSRASGYGSL